MASEGFDANAYTAPFMLTKSLQRDVYPAVDPAKNQELRAADKVILVTGGAGGIGFVSGAETPRHIHPPDLRLIQSIFLGRCQSLEHSRRQGYYPTRSNPSDTGQSSQGPQLDHNKGYCRPGRHFVPGRCRCCIQEGHHRVWPGRCRSQHLFCRQCWPRRRH